MELGQFEDEWRDREGGARMARGEALVELVDTVRERVSLHPGTNTCQSVLKASFKGDLLGIFPMWTMRKNLYAAVYMDRPFSTDMFF